MADKEYELFEVEVPTSAGQHVPGIKILDKNNHPRIMWVDPSVDLSSIRPLKEFDVFVDNERIPFMLDQEGNPSLAPHDGNISPSLIREDYLCKVLGILVEKSRGQV